MLVYYQKHSFKGIRFMRDFLCCIVPYLQAFSPLQALQQRTWLIHWSLFVFFNHPKGRDLVIDMFLYQPQ